MHAEAGAPAVDKAVALVVCEAINAVGSNAAALSRTEFLILEVLIEGHELQAAVELIVAAHRDRKAVVGMLVLTLAAVQGGIRDEDAFETGVLVAKGQGGVAVGARLAFNLLRIAWHRIRLERIHGVAGDAREGRGDIAQGVVDAGPLGGACKAGAEADGVVRKERVNRAEEAVGAENAAEDRKHAGAQRAVRAVEVDVRFTAEKAAALIERAVVRLEAGFEHEPHFVAVAEVFRAADTPAGTEFRGVFHRELINGVNAGLVSIRMNVGEAHVDDAVHLNVAGMS